jgi:hypothetical protein
VKRRRRLDLNGCLFVVFAAAFLFLAWLMAWTLASDAPASQLTERIFR